MAMASNTSYGAAITGDANTAVGTFALYKVYGNYNTGAGANSGDLLTRAQVGSGYVYGVSNSFFGNLAGSSFTTGSYNVAIGESAGATGQAAFSGTILIGTGANATASHQGVIGGAYALPDGSTAGSIADLYIGQGVTMASPRGIAVHASSGKGTNRAGGPLGLAGGIGVGAGQGGSIHIQVAPHGTTGSGLNPLADAAIFEETGGLTLPFLHSNSGTRFLCVDSNGVVTASTVACSGS